MNKLKNPLVIVSNGDFPTHSIPLEILKEAKSILACDGAADKLANNGYTPNIIIGDLDSIYTFMLSALLDFWCLSVCQQNQCHSRRSWVVNAKYGFNGLLPKKPRGNQQWSTSVGRKCFR